jgi:hypothetical protein
MQLHLAIDLCKWIGVLAFVAGATGAFAIGDAEQRRQAAQWVATPGLVLTWLGGYGLLEAHHFSLKSTWVVGALLITTAILALAFAAVRTPRRRLLYGSIAGVLLFANLVLMVERPGTVIEMAPHETAP